MLTPIFESIPESLKNHPFWAVWPAEPKPTGKIKKRPVGTDGRYLASDKLSGWNSFTNVQKYFEATKGTILPKKEGPITGPGILLCTQSSLVGIDFDHVINPDGTFETWAEPIINELKAITYCEISPSGTGIHAYLCGKKPDKKCKGGPNNALEIYENGRFLTITGHALPDCQPEIADGPEAQAMIDKLMDYAKNWKNESMSTEGGEAQELDAAAFIAEADKYVSEVIESYKGEKRLNDDEVIQKASTAKNGGQFTKLFYHGDSDYPSASEAELALCNKLAWWTNKDAAQIDRIMRQSALLKEPERLKKWDEKHGDRTYGAMTIDKACADCKGGYGDSSKKKTKNYQYLPDTGKPKISYVVGKIDRIISEFDQVIHNKAWRYGNVVSYITKLPEAKSYRGVRQPKGASIIVPYTVESLTLLASKCATWTTFNKKGEEHEIDVPLNIMRIYLAAKNDWTLPILTGIATCPIIRPDGSLLNKPGYDPDMGLYCDFNPKKFPAVKNNPDINNAYSALGLLDAALSEFPFKTEIDKAVALAAMLTTVLRPSVKSAPLFAFSAPCPGTGKSALADLIGIIATGKTCAVMDYNNDEAEFKKSLFTTLLEGSPVILIDNIIGELKNSLLYQAITQEEIKGRILGASQNATISPCSIWLATGNNLTITGELPRRTLICTLDANTERPAEREFGRNLYTWADNHRGELVHAALTILRAYHLAGRPIPNGTKPMNGFNDWSHWVRGALLWLGIDDPKDSQIEIEAHDPERESLRAVLNAWHDHFGSDFVTTKDLLARITPDGGALPNTQVDLYQALLEAIPYGRELNGKLLGKWLARHDGRVIDGLKLINTGETRQRLVYWKVVKI